MKQIEVKDLNGNNVGQFDLPENIFGVDYSPMFFNEYIRSCRLSQRSGTANTKNRSDVSGSGKKRRRQKKSGRARMGEIAPHHRGGPVAHGPRVVNKEELHQQKAVISKHMNKNQKKKALAMVLTSKLSKNDFMLIDNLSLTRPSSKDFKAISDKLNLNDGVLFVDSAFKISKIKNINKEDSFCAFYMSARNFSHVRISSTFTMSVHSILKNKKLAMTVEALRELMLRYGGKNE